MKAKGEITMVALLPSVRRPHITPKTNRGLLHVAIVVYAHRKPWKPWSVTIR
jgi:hypothetical protein